MTQRVQIDEIFGKTDQGYCGVYGCKGDDGHIYYVKGHNAGRLDQAKEWICGNLAKDFGLPMAEFCLVNICPSLYDILPPEFEPIKYGTCFASREVKLNQWLEPKTMAQAVTPVVQNDILLFDRWIRNDDRTYGNPNLLWVPHEQRLAVIDHNLAFDPDFEPDSFFSDHVFSSARDRVFGDLATIAEYKERMDKALLGFQQSVDTVSREWPWLDIEETRPFELDSDAFLSILNEYNTPQFWSMK